MNKTINQNNLNASLRMLDKMGKASLEQLKATDPQQGERLEQLNSLLKNEDFCQKFIACAHKQEAARLFADYGLTLTETELEGLISQIRTITQKLLDNDGELSEEHLEQIAGGWSWGSFFAALASGVTFAGTGGAIVGSTIPGIGTVVGGLIGAVVGVGIGVVGGLFC